MPNVEPLSERREPGGAAAPDAPSRPVEWANFFVERLIAHERAFERMEKSFISFRVWVTTILGLAGAVIGIAGWGIISSAWSLQRDLGRIDANLSSYTASMDRLDKFQGDVARMDAKLSSVTVSMDRLEKSNEKLSDKIDRLSEVISRMQGRLERDAAPATKGGQ